MLVTNQTIRSRNAHLESLVDEWQDIDPRGTPLSGAAIADALIIRRLMRRLKSKKIDRVVFNTGQGGHVRNACLFSLFRKIEFIGIVHTTRKFQGSLTQKVISLKIKKYLVLAHFLNDQIPKNKINTTAFYPIDFPHFQQDFDENNTNLHIAIVGGVETRRKDLAGFISMIKQRDSSATFSFLGNANSTHLDVVQFKEKLAEINCLERVEFFENYIDSETIHRILRKTDAILTLIHPETPSAEEYFKHQIPGSMNIALGYKIPLLLHESFRGITELTPASIYYNVDLFDAALEEVKLKGNAIRNKMNSTEEYRSTFQQKKYLDFIFDQAPKDA